MSAASRPHVLGVDDGAFDRLDATPATTPIVGVLMEGNDQVEAVAQTAFPLDGAGATQFLSGWIEELRCRPTLHGVVLGGITIAGLGVIDVVSLARSLSVPILVANRRDPSDHQLHRALDAAGLAERKEIVDRTPPSFEIDSGLWLACAGIDPDAARALIRATLFKSTLPEPLRLAHLIATAAARGESHGRA